MLALISVIGLLALFFLMGVAIGAIEVMWRARLQHSKTRRPIHR